jgi:hypothetical protein
VRVAADALRAAAERRATEVRMLLEPYGGQCWWCRRAVHDPAGCPLREVPDMRDFDLRVPSRTRITVETTRTPEQQQQHRKDYSKAYNQRVRALEAEAQTRALAVAAMDRAAPLRPAAPLDQFTVWQLIVLEFALELPEHLPVGANLVASDRAALQALAKLVKDIPGGSSSAPFKALDSLRATEDSAETSFYILHCRAVHHASDLRALLHFHRQQERLKHPNCTEVQALPAEASLLRILQEAAAKPPRGRRERGAAAGRGGSGFFEVAANWADGGYTAEAMEARTQFDSRRINVSLKMSQFDVLAGSALLFKAVPSLTELKAFKPRDRPVKLAHAATARLHAEQLNLHHVIEAAERVKGWFPQWDEGSKSGATAVCLTLTRNPNPNPNHNPNSNPNPAPNPNPKPNLNHRSNPYPRCWSAAPA